MLDGTAGGATGRFVIYLACTIEGERLNAGVDFGHRPLSLASVVRVGEALYSPEVQLRTGFSNSIFTCVACVVHDVISQSWVELKAVEQLTDGCQVFMFDASRSAPSRGPLPRVNVIVTAREILRAAEVVSSTPTGVPIDPRSDSALRNTDRTTAGTAGRPTRLNAPASGLMHTPRQGSGTSGFESTSFRPQGGRLPSFQPSSQLPASTRAFLYEQLCRMSGSQNGGPLPAQFFHSVCMENGLFFSSDEFSEILGDRLALDMGAWEELAHGFGPVLDVLYDRIATRTAIRAAQRSRQVAGDASSPPNLADMKKELEDLADEEATINARLAAIQQRKVALQREIREEQKREKELEPNGTEDRQKEWETLHRFVALRIKQINLRLEEERVSQQLNLL